MFKRLKLLINKIFKKEKKLSENLVKLKKDPYKKGDFFFLDSRKIDRNKKSLQIHK